MKCMREEVLIWQVILLKIWDNIKYDIAGEDVDDQDSKFRMWKF